MIWYLISNDNIHPIEKFMKKLKLLVYDFDGVMTNNKVFINQDGIESVQVNRADGLGVSEINKLGIKQLIISTEKIL